MSLNKFINVSIGVDFVVSASAAAVTVAVVVVVVVVKIERLLAYK